LNKKIENSTNDTLILDPKQVVEDNEIFKNELLKYQSEINQISNEKDIILTDLIIKNQKEIQ